MVVANQATQFSLPIEVANALPAVPSRRSSRVLSVRLAIAGNDAECDDEDDETDHTGDHRPRSKH